MGDGIPQRRAQARALHGTVRMLKNRLIARHARCVANGERSMPCAAQHLTMPQMNCLMTLREYGAVSLKELAEALGISPPSASTMVERLVEMGTATREQSSVDRREVVVSLSPVGARVLDAVEAQILEGIEELLERIGPEYAEKWCEVYDRIREVLQNEPELKGTTT